MKTKQEVVEFLTNHKNLELKEIEVCDSDRYCYFTDGIYQFVVFKCKYGELDKWTSSARYIDNELAKWQEET